MQFLCYKKEHYYIWWMKIQSLGHAGFWVESEKTIIVCDPWLSDQGAFDGAWFQYPCNHHLADTVLDKFHTSSKQKFIYISHEHKDHFDINFLKTLIDCDFQFIIPSFRRNELFSSISAHFTQKVVLALDNLKITAGDCNVTLFIDDNELNRDSAILISNEDLKFLNLNDCKIYDRLTKIRNENKNIAALAIQFSGATWHPTCYDYDEETYSKISKKKVLSKFELVAKAIDKIAPKFVIPSAGPACFLDPDLIHINFQESNIFPKADLFINYLQRRNKIEFSKCYNLLPSDILDLESDVFTSNFDKSIHDENFETYIREYASRYDNFFEKRKKKINLSSKEKYWKSLIQILVGKLDAFTEKKQIHRCLYFQLYEIDDQLIKIDFQNNILSIVPEITEKDHYLISVHLYDLVPVLDKEMTWEDFSLTFRMKLNREPDIYQVLIQGFLILEAEDLEMFCEHVISIENKNERITIEVQGCKMTVDRYCPHQGADLKNGWIEEDRYLICPRHGWRFDLMNEGTCHSNNACVHAINLEEFL